MSERAIDLSKFDDDFRTKPIGDPHTFDAVPDGKFTAVIERANLSESFAGNPVWTMMLRIVGSAFNGRMLPYNSTITRATLQYVKRDLLRCGLQLESLSELPNHFHDLIGLRLEIVKKTRNGHMNVYLNRVLDEGAQRRA